MRIFELVNPPTPANMAPGSKIGPVGPGTVPSGAMSTPNTEQKPNTSNTPKTPQSTATLPNNQQNLKVGEPMGTDTQQTQAPEQTVNAGGPAPVAPGGRTQVASQPVSNQDLTNQLKALMRRITAIQTDPANQPVNQNQPGVSGDSTLTGPQV